MRPCLTRQVPPPFYRGNASACFSEECLFINVHRPANATPSSKLPVMFFIHGGSMKMGSGGAACPGPGGGAEGGFYVDMFDGGALAVEHGVVVASINYRLDVRHPHLALHTPPSTLS